MPPPPPREHDPTHGLCSFWLGPLLRCLDDTDDPEWVGGLVGGGETARHGQPATRGPARQRSNPHPVVALCGRGGGHNHSRGHGGLFLGATVRGPVWGLEPAAPSLPSPNPPHPKQLCTRPGCPRREKGGETQLLTPREEWGVFSLSLSLSLSGRPPAGRRGETTKILFYALFIKRNKAFFLEQRLYSMFW